MLEAVEIQQALDQAIATLKADSGTVHVKAAGRDVLVLSASRNIPPPVLEIVREVAWGKGMAGLAVERLQAVQVCDIQTTTSPDVRPGARGAGMQGAIVVPMLRAGVAVGAFGVACAAERDFTQDETRWLLDFAADLALRLEA